jgi:hypothetical protein
MDEAEQSTAEERAAQSLEPHERRELEEHRRRTVGLATDLAAAEPRILAIQGHNRRLLRKASEYETRVSQLESCAPAPAQTVMVAQTSAGVLDGVAVAQTVEPRRPREAVLEGKLEAAEARIRELEKSLESQTFVLASAPVKAVERLLPRKLSDAELSLNDTPAAQAKPGNVCPSCGMGDIERRQITLVDEAQAHEADALLRVEAAKGRIEDLVVKLTEQLREERCTPAERAVLDAMSQVNVAVLTRKGYEGSSHFKRVCRAELARRAEVPDRICPVCERTLRDHHTCEVKP